MSCGHGWSRAGRCSIMVLTTAASPDSDAVTATETFVHRAAETGTDFFPHVAGVHAYLKLLGQAAEAADRELAEEVARLGPAAAPRIARALDLAAVTLTRLRAHLDACCNATHDLERLRGVLTSSPVPRRRAAEHE